MRQEIPNYLQSLQDTITARLEDMDGHERFHEDAWEHADGGGGRTRVLREGKVFERAGVNFSEVYGETLPESIAEQFPEAAGHPFGATGLSLVIHPLNPHVPTVHMNYRFFEAGPVWWFGGGMDLTPYYPYEEESFIGH